MGPNELPTVRLRIGSIDATGQAEEPAHVRVRVNNIGAAAARLNAAVTLVTIDADGTECTVAKRRLPGAASRPGGSASSRATSAKLAPGRYRVGAVLDGSGGDTQTATTRVLASNDFSTADRFGRFFTEHPTRTVGLVALLVIAALLVALLRTRRSLRR